MALGKEEGEQRRGLEESWGYADVGIEELWLRYFTLGGQAGQFEVEAYIHGAMALPALQRDILAHALNERLDEMQSQAPRAPYSRDDQNGEDDEGLDAWDDPDAWDDGSGGQGPAGGPGDGWA